MTFRFIGKYLSAYEDQGYAAPFCKAKYTAACSDVAMLIPFSFFSGPKVASLRRNRLWSAFEGCFPGACLVSVQYNLLFKI